jgi:hypothetical protein
MNQESENDFDQKVDNLTEGMSGHNVRDLAILIDKKVANALTIERINTDATHVFLQNVNLELASQVHDITAENGRVVHALTNVRWKYAYVGVRVGVMARQERKIRQQLVSEISALSRPQNVPNINVPAPVAVPPSIYMQACTLGVKLTLAYSLNETVASYTGVDCLEKLYVKSAYRWLFGVKKSEAVVPVPVVALEHSLEKKKMTVNAGELLPPEKVFEIGVCVGDVSLPVRCMPTYYW